MTRTIWAGPTPFAPLSAGEQTKARLHGIGEIDVALVVRADGWPVGWRCRCGAEFALLDSALDHAEACDGEEATR